MRRTINSTLTSFFQEDRLAKKVEEFHLYAAKVVANLVFLDLPKTDTQWPLELISTSLPQLIECVL